MQLPYTMLPEIIWPAIPTAYSSSLLAVVFQLEQSQWWPADQLAAVQYRQLAPLVEHAYRTVPFYRQRFDGTGLDPATLASPDRYAALPLLTRRDIQISAEQMHSSAVPEAHLPLSSMATSGSTNAPVVTVGTRVSEFFWRALTLRDHLWHRRDLSQSLAAIRYTGNATCMPPDGGQSESWGPATSGTIPTGPTYLLNVQSTIDEQIDWVRRVEPGYLLAYPSALREMAKQVERESIRFANLREIRTFGEVLEPECRAICQRAFNVPVVDMYSSQEVGYIALQCPAHQHYHVQSENLLVEILDDAGRQCGPGQIGRVVVTTLHNFAMPLLRYDIGDYAEVGAACDCGRGLPVLKRIMGRQRNLLKLPDGQLRWPIFNAGERPESLPAFFQFQVIQRERERIEVLMVSPAPLSADQEGVVTRYMQQTLGYPFAITLTRVDAIPRGATGKFEDFVCQV